MLIPFIQTYAQGRFYYALIVKSRRSVNLKMSLCKSRMALLALGIIFNLFVISHASALQEIPPFNTELERIIRRELPANCQISCQVVDLNSGRVLMEKNPSLPLTPASTQKIVTSACALDTLGPEFRFATQVYTDEIKGGSAENLFLKGHGDPHLVTEELFALIRELADKGLTEIRGSIVVDDSYFDPDKPLDEAEELGYRSYHAPYSALSLNFNSLKITVIPGNAPGNPARFLMDPLSDYASLNGHVNTVPGAGAMKIEISKKPAEADRERLFLEGSIGVEAPAKGKYVNVQFPALYTGSVFKELLLREGIKVRGNIIKGVTPANAILYFEHQSMPLSLLVYWLDKLSNNFMAEQMCLAIGAHVHGAPGSREKGLDVMRRFLIKAGIPETSFNLADASGLSRSNKISASALVKTLSVASQDFYYSPEFISSLGISGADGTLKEKFKDENTRRRIRAKTGTLRGVNSLAGFGLGKNGKPIVFAVLVNSEQKGAGIIDYADKIMRAIFSSSLNR